MEATSTLQEAPLADHHQRMLEITSAISQEVIAERGYFTVNDSGLLREMGFADYQLRVPALAIPVFGVGGEFRFYRIRPDEPRGDLKKAGKVIKYEQPAESSITIDVPRGAQPYLSDTGTRLWIVEGEKKADALVSRGECAIALLGVWAWKRDSYPLPEWDHIPMIGRDVRVLFDSDAAEKVEVRHALFALSRFLKGKVHGA